MMMTVYSHLMSVVNTKRSHSERQVIIKPGKNWTRGTN